MLDAWLDGRKVKRMKTPPPEVVYELWRVLNELELHGVSETITGEVKDMMEEHGYEVAEEGIGWKISRAEEMKAKGAKAKKRKAKGSEAMR